MDFETLEKELEKATTEGPRQDQAIRHVIDAVPSLIAFARDMRQKLIRSELSRHGLENDTPTTFESSENARLRMLVFDVREALQNLMWSLPKCNRYDECHDIAVCTMRLHPEDPPALCLAHGDAGLRRGVLDPLPWAKTLAAAEEMLTKANP